MKRQIDPQSLRVELRRPRPPRHRSRSLRKPRSRGLCRMLPVLRWRGRPPQPLRSAEKRSRSALPRTAGAGAWARPRLRDEGGRDCRPSRPPLCVRPQTETSCHLNLTCKQIYKWPSARCKPAQEFLCFTRKRCLASVANLGPRASHMVYTSSPHSHHHLPVTHLTLAHTWLRHARQHAAHLLATVHTINNNYPRSQPANPPSLPYPRPTSSSPALLAAPPSTWRNDTFSHLRHALTLLACLLLSLIQIKP